MRRSFSLLVVTIVSFLAGCSPTVTISHRTSTTTTTMAANAVRCAASSLTLRGGWQGATGSLLGGIRFTNNGTEPCTLQGYLKLVLLDGAGTPIPSVGVLYTNNALPQPPSVPPPAVILVPHKQDAANELVQWFNWCQGSAGVVSIEVSLPDGLTRPAVMGIGAPRCDDPTRGTSIEEEAVKLTSTS